MAQRTPTTEPGYVNQHGLVTLGRGDPERIDPTYEATQYVHVMHCPCCRENCGVAGCAIWIRKCPTCFRAECPRCYQDDDDVADGPELYPHEKTWGRPSPLSS